SVADYRPPASWREGAALVLRRTLRTGVADSVQDVRDGEACILRRHSLRRIPACDVEGALAGMRIGSILRPSMFLAFADGAGLLQHGDAQPRSIRIALGLSFVISIAIKL